MLDQSSVFEVLAQNGVTFFCGVPDSYLNGFCNYALEHCGERNIIAANEGNAIAIAAGHYLASREIPLVYMQNSGEGNAVNPLASLADQNVYAVPMLLLIGWRGQGNTEPNHPQHKLQGEITPELLKIMHIPFSILEDDDKIFAQTVSEATEYCRRTRGIYAFIAPKCVMADPEKKNNADDLYPLSREEAIEIILDHMPRDTVNVGSMGHASSVALGIALEKPETPVVVLDGDAAAIMHMGALTMVGKLSAPNFMHIVLNNGAHESVGGQASAGHRIDFTKIAEGCGYATPGGPVTNAEELIKAVETLRCCGRASFIDCRIHKGLTRKLPPIVFDHREYIDALIEEINKKTEPSE